MRLPAKVSLAWYCLPHDPHVTAIGICAFPSLDEIAAGLAADLGDNAAQAHSRLKAAAALLSIDRAASFRQIGRI
jgi:hypothetical protein